MWRKWGRKMRDAELASYGGVTYEICQAFSDFMRRPPDMSFMAASILQVSVADDGGLQRDLQHSDRNPFHPYTALSCNCLLPPLSI
jgi:hypothetical protein